MNIVVAIRKSPLFFRILEKAGAYAGAFGGTLYLVTSISDGPDQHARELDEARKTLEEAVEILEKEGIDCNADLLIQGQSSGEDIVALARKKNADTIFVGIENTSRFGKFVMGSTAQYVIMNAECPVYTVK